jgi:hypothetical protein
MSSTPTQRWKGKIRLTVAGTAELALRIAVASRVALTTIVDARAGLEGGAGLDVVGLGVAGLDAADLEAVKVAT